MPKQFTDKPTRTTSLLFIGALLIAAFALWAGALGTFFNQDDFILIDGARQVRSQPDLFTTIFLEPGIMDGVYRPLSTYLYFTTVDRLFGLDPAVYHLISLAVHLLCGLLIYGLLLRAKAPLPAAFLAAFFFLSRDAFFANLYWISAIQDNLMTLLTLGAVFSFSLWLEGGRKRLYLLAVLSYALALLAKETALAVFPLFIISAAATPGKLSHKIRLLGALVPAVLGIAFTCFRLGVIGPAQLSLDGLSFGSLLRYLGWLVDSAAFDPPAATGLAVIVLLLLATPAAYLALRRSLANEEAARFNGLLISGWSLLVLGLLPALIYTKAACQYYLYLPGAGLALLLGVFLTAPLARLEFRKAVILVLLFAAALLFSSRQNINERQAGRITPGGFYHPVNAEVSRLYIHALTARSAKIRPGDLVVLTGYPQSYSLEASSWRAIPRLYFKKNFNVLLATDLKQDSPPADLAIDLERLLGEIEADAAR